MTGFNCVSTREIGLPLFDVEDGERVYCSTPGYGGEIITTKSLDIGDKVGRVHVIDSFDSGDPHHEYWLSHGRIYDNIMSASVAGYHEDSNNQFSPNFLRKGFIVADNIGSKQLGDIIYDCPPISLIRPTDSSTTFYLVEFFNEESHQPNKDTCLAYRARVVGLLEAAKPFHVMKNEKISRTEHDIEKISLRECYQELKSPLLHVPEGKRVWVARPDHTGKCYQIDFDPFDSEHILYLTSGLLFDTFEGAYFRKYLLDKVPNHKCVMLMGYLECDWVESTNSTQDGFVYNGSADIKHSRDDIEQVGVKYLTVGYFSDDVFVQGEYGSIVTRYRVIGSGIPSPY